MSVHPSSEAVSALFVAYIDSVKAYMVKHVRGHSCPIEPDEELMRSVEVSLHVSDGSRDAFRRSLLDHIGGLALAGKSFEPHTNPRLHHALKVAVGEASAAEGSAAEEPLSERGLRLLREGASRVGTMTVTADGVSRPGDDEPKLVEARRCLEAALAEGDVRAAKPLAAMLREGLGGPVHEPRARALYEEVWERSGDRDATVTLASMMANGEGGAPDRRRAFQLLRPVAAVGDLRAVATLLNLAEGAAEIEEAERYARALKRGLRPEPL